MSVSLGCKGLGSTLASAEWEKKNRMMSDVEMGPRDDTVIVLYSHGINAVPYLSAPASEPFSPSRRARQDRPASSYARAGARVRGGYEIGQWSVWRRYRALFGARNKQ